MYQTFQILKYICYFRAHEHLTRSKLKDVAGKCYLQSWPEEGDISPLRALESAQILLRHADEINE